MADPIERLRTAARSVADTTTGPDDARLVQLRRRYRRARVAGRVAIVAGVVVVVVGLAALAGSVRNKEPDQQQSAAQPGTIVDPAFKPASADFWDADHGIVVGTCFAADCPASTKGVVDLTTDGGQTWRSVLQTTKPVTDVAVEGTSSAWLLTEDGQVWTSSDEGVTWSLEPVNVPAGATIEAMSFGSEQVGWAVAVGSDASLLATSDGGRTWTPLADPCHQTVPGGPTGQGDLIGVTAVSLPSPTAGWVLCNGDGAAGSSMQAVFRSTDGGATWTRMWSDFTVSSVGLEMLDSGVGWRWDWSAPAVFTTQDGGSTWTVAPASRELMDRYGNTPWESVTFVTPTTGYGLLPDEGAGAPGTLLRSTDGGATWSLATTFEQGPASPSP